jgi:hypothetical protein
MSSFAPSLSLFRQEGTPEEVRRQLRTDWPCIMTILGSVKLINKFGGTKEREL